MKHTLVHSGPKGNLLHDSTMPSKALSPWFIHQGLQEYMLLFSMQQNRVTTAFVTPGATGIRKYNPNDVSQKTSETAGSCDGFANF